ncbi:putative ATP-dependent endonuclease of OLD family [Pseudomonas sp. AG1028]|uniref:ATP-dependent nuclease n=1 Tax=Pseudomonas sp. AG1028 TaxID=2572911 RepID=UPI0011ABB537|nr:AAA family ATPase [Pseudomonas sp. AG1028]TWE02828.1 putative ATP-dependent endonuclease of OLD family [Pseudomonas sp. AG1028]
MKIRKLTISNFRGIGFAEIDIEDFTSFIGPNNIGKSTILHALNILLDNKKPTLDDWPNKEPSAETMEIICEFRDLEDWEKVKPAISGLLHEESLIVRLTATWPTELDPISSEYSVYCTSIEMPWANYSEAKKHDQGKVCLEELGISKADEYKAQVLEVSKLFIDKFPDHVVSNVGWHVKKFPNSLQQAVPHVMYVPACFKIEDEMKSTANTPFSFLFSNKIFPIVKSDATYQEYIAKATFLQSKLKGQAEDGSIIDGLGQALEKVTATLNQVLDFDSQVRLAIGDIDIEPLFMKAATFLIDDGFESSLQYQGSGVQRALAFAMLESNAGHASVVEGGERTVVVLYEEPELYIHPHLMRRLKQALVSKTDSPKWQVICSTHSPFLISLADKPESLKLVRKDENNQRIIHQLSSNIFEVGGEYDERSLLRATLDFHPTVCESLFAKRVVLVEGDTEVAVFSMADELLTKFDLNNNLVKDTTIISAGGKWTIPAIGKVLNTLGISYKVIHDEDRHGLTDAELEEKAAIHPYKANAKIASVANAANTHVISDTFEHVLWDASADEIASSKDKPYNSWRRIRAFLDGEQDLTPGSQQKIKSILEFAFCN